MLTVFVVGLVYFDGCDEPEMRAWVPDGRSGIYVGDVAHRASLWIQADQVADATQWGSPADRPARSVDGVPFIEFLINEPSQIQFPDQGDPLACRALDAVMPKLKKEKKKDDETEDFEIDRERAVTIAQVPIRGGTLVPYEITNKNRSGLVRWTMESSSGGVITTGSRSITLAPGDAEVVFSNIHDIPLTAHQDHLRDDDHIQLFRQLIDPSLRETTRLVPDKPGKLDEVVTANAYVRFLDHVNFTCGVTPPCCARLAHA